MTEDKIKNSQFQEYSLEGLMESFPFGPDYGLISDAGSFTLYHLNNDKPIVVQNWPATFKDFIVECYEWIYEQEYKDDMDNFACLIAKLITYKIEGVKKAVVEGSVSISKPEPHKEIREKYEELKGKGIEVSWRCRHDGYWGKKNYYTDLEWYNEFDYRIFWEEDEKITIDPDDGQTWPKQGTEIYSLEFNDSVVHFECGLKDLESSEIAIRVQNHLNPKEITLYKRSGFYYIKKVTQTMESKGV